MKKNIFLFILLTILFIPNIAFATDPDTGSNGDAAHSGATTGAKSGLHIRDEDNDYGIRITVVSEIGTRKSKKTYDYWNTDFDSTKIWKLNGSSWKTDIINKGGVTGLTFGSKYTTSEYKIGETSIGGPWYTTNWDTIHETLLAEVSKIDSKNCKNPTFLTEVGYDICSELSDCEALKKTYILIEPLVRLHSADNTQIYILSGTEFANYVPYAYKRGYISYDVYSNNLGDSVFKNLMNFYLSNQPNDDLTYSLRKKNGGIYSYFSSTPATTWLPNQSDDQLDIFAGKKMNVNNDPRGSSMQLVWLGKIEDKCKNDECCVPCDPNDTACIEKAGDNYHVDDPYCCLLTGKDEQIALGYDDNGNLVCGPADDYWNTHDIPEYCMEKCVPPANDPTYCCDDPIWQKENPEDYEIYCTEPDSCKPSSITPEAETKACDTDGDSSNNVSYFRDGVFNSQNGQFSDVNTVEMLNNSISNGYLPSEWMNRVVTEYADNSFLGLAYKNDYTYSDTINDYCNIHCQEISDIQLPDNFPFVEAGRYFTWSIDNSKDLVVEKNALLCATDIDLDKAIEQYKKLNNDAIKAASQLANLNCKENYGVNPVIDADYSSCDDYALDYYNNCAPDSVCVEVKESGHCSVCVERDEKGTCTKTAPGPISYTCSKTLTGAAAKKFYTYEGGTAYSPGCGSTGATTVIPQLTICNKYLGEYQEAVQGHSKKVQAIYDSISACMSGIDESESNLELEVNYSTLLSDNDYLSINEDIEKIPGDSNNGAIFGCYNLSDSTECNIEDIYTMSDRRDGLICNVNQKTWNGKKEYNLKYKGNNKGAVSPIDQNEQYINYYDSNSIKMLGIKDFSRTNGFIISDTIDFTNKWNTIYLSLMSNESYYRLVNSINACVCLDGTVEDANEDGKCDCNIETYTEYEITNSEYGEYYCKVEWESKTYYKIPEGNFSVEFMNPSGYYPLSLNYSNIGFDGHFSTLFINGDLQDKNEHCDSSIGTCHYSDEDGVCYFELKNKVLIDNGDVDDFICGDDECPPPPPPCSNPPCKPDDNCKDGECKVGGLEIIYRQVDLDNPFPNRIPGTNWFNEQNDFTEVITNNRDVEGSKLYSSNLEPLYSITMTPAIIKEIRKVNAALNYDYASEETMIYGDNNTNNADSNGDSNIYGVSVVLRNEIQKITVKHKENFTINLDGDDRFTAIIEIADDGLNCSIDGVTE